MGTRFPQKLALALGACLALPGPASAATTIGSDLSAAPDDALVCIDTGGCTIGHTSVPGRTVAVPHDGVLVRWRARFLPDQPDQAVNLNVLRRVGDSYTSVAINPHNDVPAFLVAETRIPVRQGDLIAVDLQDGGEIGIATHPSADAGFVSFVPRLGRGTTRSPDSGDIDAELLVNADIEADGDGDGYGDETQDKCPGSRSVSEWPCWVDMAALQLGTSPMTNTPVRLQVGRRSTLEASIGRGYVPHFPENPGVPHHVPVPAAVVTLDVAPRVELLDASSSVGPCDVSGGRAVCGLGTPGHRFLPVEYIKLRVRPDARALTPATVRVGAGFSATVSAPGDRTPGNDARSWVVPIDAPRCGVRIAGNTRRNRLVGTPFGDRIVGGGGDDVLRGRAGRDCLYGGRGDDRLVAVDGTRDVVKCGPGDDVAWVDRRDKVSGCERVVLRRG